MGGAGRRRREKNYRAAHGGYSRLPPPPNYSKADALPSKLRRLLAFTASHESPDSLMLSKDAEQKNRSNEQKNRSNEQKNRSNGVGADEPKPADEVDLETRIEDEDEAENLAPQGTDEKKKKKRKRRQVEDLRFETEQAGGRLKRKERRKKYLEAKKNKKKKGKIDENKDFPGREKIKFGDVVQAPPKLVVPKALKTVQDVYKERLRDEAIEAYRQRKGSNARLGIQLPPPVTSL